MRVVILKDDLISSIQLAAVTDDFSKFIKRHTGIEVTCFQHTIDYSEYPTEIDSDGHVRPTYSFLKEQADFVYSKYAKFGTDHVVVLVHKKNWKSGRIWGTNFSNIFHGYQLHYCRFDSDNLVNAFATIYHEIHHSLDALVQTTVGINIAPLVPVNNWDNITHGKEGDWKYIRNRENAESLKIIKTPLFASYQKRLAFHKERVGLMKQVIRLLQLTVVLLREKLNKKYGVNNK